MTFVRFVTVLVWMAAGASLVGWWLSGSSVLAPTGPAAPVAASSSPLPADWSALMRAHPQAPSGSPAMPFPSGIDSTRYRLLGVAGSVKGGAGVGVALLSVDGGPARALRAGQLIDTGVAVLEISAHEVRIGPLGGPPALTLQAPLMPPPAVGSLPGT